MSIINIFDSRRVCTVLADKRSTIQLLQWAFTKRAKRIAERFECGSEVGAEPRIEHLTAPNRSQSSENLVHAAAELQVASGIIASEDGDGALDLAEMLAEYERLRALPAGSLFSTADGAHAALGDADAQSVAQNSGGRTGAEEALWATRMKPNRRGIPVFEFELPDADSMVDVALDVNREQLGSGTGTAAASKAKPPAFSRQSSTHSSTANPLILYITPTSASAAAASSSVCMNRLSPSPAAQPLPPKQALSGGALRNSLLSAVQNAQTDFTDGEFEQILKPIARSACSGSVRNTPETADTASEHSSGVRDNGADDSPPTPRAIVSRIAFRQQLHPPLRPASSAVNSASSGCWISSSSDLCVGLDGSQLSRQPLSSTSASLQDAAAESDAACDGDGDGGEDTRSEMSLQSQQQTPQLQAALSSAAAAANAALKSYEHSRSEADLITRLAQSHAGLRSSATTALQTIELADPLAFGAHSEANTPSPAHTEASFAQLHRCGGEQPAPAQVPVRRQGFFSSLRNLFRAASRERVQSREHLDSLTPTPTCSERKLIACSKLTLPPADTSSNTNMNANMNANANANTTALKYMTFGAPDKAKSRLSNQQLPLGLGLELGGGAGAGVKSNTLNASASDKTASSRARARLRMAPVHCSPASSKVRNPSLTFGQSLQAAAHAYASPASASSSASASASNSCHSTPQHSFAANGSGSSATPARAGAQEFAFGERTSASGSASDRVHPVKKLFALLLGQRRRRTRNSSLSRAQDARDSPDPLAEARATTSVYCTMRKQKKDPNGKHRAVSVEAPAAAHRRQHDSGAAAASKVKAASAERRSSAVLGGAQSTLAMCENGRDASVSPTLPYEAMCVSVLALDVPRAEQYSPNQQQPRHTVAPPKPAQKPTRGKISGPDRGTLFREEPFPFADSEYNPYK